MEKRVILALALSLFILVGYQLLMAKFYPQPTYAARKEIEIQKTEAKEPQKPIPAQKPESPTILPNEKEIIFENKVYKIIFSDVGAGVKKITLNKNPGSGLNISYDIFTAADPEKGLFLFLPDKFGAMLNNVKYEVKEFEGGVLFSRNFNNEFILEKRFNLRNSLYLIELEMTWKNLKGQEIANGYSLISGSHLKDSSMEERFLEISASIDEKILKYKRQRKPFEVHGKGIFNWVMLKNRYFSIITKPNMPSFEYSIHQMQDDTILTTVDIKEFTIPPNSSLVHKLGIYAGPSDLSLLKEANIGAENALTYGFFGSISQLLMGVLKFFHKVARNWGVAIILLTLFINIVLFPLSRKSYKSMHEMQVLQPKIEKLRQELKSNPQKLQKEIMELYKKYKVNPMAGCLPMILQMPIFIALYQGLMHSLELRGAGFLWVRDLSSPENIKLPFTLPLLGNSLNILPILMLVAMFVQQRLSNKITSMAQTDEQRQQQKMMSVMMSIMFGFIFYNMPSGFVLYWLCSTAIMTVYQTLLTKRPVQVEQHA